MKENRKSDSTAGSGGQKDSESSADREQMSCGLMMCTAEVFTCKRGQATCVSDDFDHKAAHPYVTNLK